MKAAVATVVGVVGGPEKAEVVERLAAADGIVRVAACDTVGRVVVES